MGALLSLYGAFLKVGTFALGGGYTLIPLIEHQVVTVHGWLSREEFLEVLGVTQGLPGAISVKLATYTGFKIAGPLGVVAANLGNLTAPVVVMLALYGILHRLAGWPGVDRFLLGVRAGTWGLLLGFALILARATPQDARGVLIALAALVALAFLRVDPALVVVGAGVLGLALFR